MKRKREREKRKFIDNKVMKACGVSYLRLATVDEMVNLFYDPRELNRSPLVHSARDFQLRISFTSAMRMMRMTLKVKVFVFIEAS